MNKWIIFIIVVIGISVIGVGTNLVRNYTTTLTTEPIADETGAATQGEPRLVVRFTNISEYPVSPGVLVFHNQNFSMNFLGGQAPKEYESFAEVGDPKTVIALIQEDPNVHIVFGAGGVEPRTTQEIVIPLPAVRDYDDARMSYMARVEETNDGVVWLNGHPISALYDEESSQIQQKRIVTEIIDMGTEQNAPIGSGFSGGQPDPSRGVENIDNGIATSEPVQHHPQFYEDDAVSNEVIQININVEM